MPRKITITKQMIFDAAFELLKEEGIDNVTARKLAVKIGCSTQPIFRVYDGMEQLHAELFVNAMDYFDSYYIRFPRKSEVPFVNLGLAFIQFAVQEPRLFQVLFLQKERQGKQLYEILNGKTEAVKMEFMQASRNGSKNPGDLFTKMWIFIHGAACMTITGDYDLNENDTIKLLEEVCKAFLK